METGSGILIASSSYFCSPSLCLFFGYFNVPEGGQAPCGLTEAEQNEAKQAKQSTQWEETELERGFMSCSCMGRTSRLLERSRDGPFVHGVCAPLLVLSLPLFPLNWPPDDHGVKKEGQAHINAPIIHTSAWWNLVQRNKATSWTCERHCSLDVNSLFRSSLGVISPDACKGLHAQLDPSHESSTTPQPQPCKLFL